MKILIAGGSGFIGQELAKSLSEDSIVTLGRTRLDRPAHFIWDPASGSVEHSAFEDVDIVLNLTGENVASGYWTAAKMERIRRSRLDSTKLVVNSIASLAKRPKTLINASAIGFYGDRGAEELSEDCSPGSGFFPEVCCAWEAEAMRAQSLGIRVVLLRFGIVLDKAGGALPKMLLPFKLGLGGVVGSGNQFVSWITLQDAVSAIRFLIEREDLHGPFNIVSPHSVTNREFSKTIGEILHRPSFMPLPAAVARLTLGAMANEMLLASTKVIPKRLMDAGFGFHHARLKPALQELLGS